MSEECRKSRRHVGGVSEMSEACRKCTVLSEMSDMTFLPTFTIRESIVKYVSVSVPVCVSFYGSAAQGLSVVLRPKSKGC